MEKWEGRVEVDRGVEKGAEGVEKGRKEWRRGGRSGEGEEGVERGGRSGEGEEGVEKEWRGGDLKTERKVRSRNIQNNGGMKTKKKE